MKRGIKHTVFYISLLVFCFMFTALVLAVDNSVTIGTASGTTISGSYNFTATLTNYNLSNCTWYTSTDATTYVPFGSWINASGADNTTFSNVTDTTGITDNSAYYINVTCFQNEAGTSWEDAISAQASSVVIDNTAPSACSIKLATGIIQRLSLVKSDARDSLDAIDSSMDLLYRIIRPDNSIYALNRTNTSDKTETWDGKEFPFVGIYTINLTLVDNGGNVAGCSNTVQVISEDDDEIVIQKQIETATGIGPSGSNTPIVIGIAAVVLFIGAIVVIIVVKTGKKRR